MQYINTLAYYENHADKFFENTVNVAFGTIQKNFCQSWGVVLISLISVVDPGATQSVFWNRVTK